MHRASTASLRPWLTPPTARRQFLTTMLEQAQRGVGMAGSTSHLFFPGWNASAVSRTVGWFPGRELELTKESRHQSMPCTHPTSLAPTCRSQVTSISARLPLPGAAALVQQPCCPSHLPSSRVFTVFTGKLSSPNPLLLPEVSVHYCLPPALYEKAAHSVQLTPCPFHGLAEWSLSTQASGNPLPPSLSLLTWGFCFQTTTNHWKGDSVRPGFITLTYLMELLSYSMTGLGILGEEMVRERTEASPRHRSVSVIPGWGPQGSVLSITV